MTLFRKLSWWMQRRRREAELREELEFHLDEEAEARRADGLPSDQARSAARRDLGNVTLLREETRTLWTWTLLEQVAQDLRFALRTMRKNPAFTALAALSLALGIGANTAIYSFMDAILLRSLPVADPASLVVIGWRSKPFDMTRNDFVMHGIDGSTYRDASGVTAGIFPFPAFERLQQASSSVFSSIFAHDPAGRLNVMVRGEAEQADGEYVSGDFFRGLSVSPAAGRMILVEDDRIGAPPVVVISAGYSQRRFGDAAKRGRSADADRQRRLYRGGRGSCRVLRRRSERESGRVHPDAREAALRPKRRGHLPRAKLLLGPDDGTPAPRRLSCAGARPRWPHRSRSG